MTSSVTLSRWLKILRHGRPIYYLADLCKLSGLSVDSMRRAAQRLMDQGLLHKAGKEIYLNALMPVGIEELAMLLYRPCYISMESALFYHGIITQAPFVNTCVTTRATRKMTTPLGEIIYQHIKPTLYFGYEKNAGFFLAEAEKAALDFVYLNLQNGHRPHLDEWDWTRLSLKRLKCYAKKYPQSVKTILLPYLKKPL